MDITSSLGLDSLHYCLVTGDSTTGYTTGTVYPLVGAKALSYTTAASLVSNFFDDKVGELFESTGEKAITLSVACLLPEDEARITGKTYANGEILEANSDSSPYIAIMGRALMGNGSYGYFTYYKVKFGKPNSEDTTREATPSPRTVTLEGRVADTIYNGVSKSKLRSDDTTIPANRITNYFTAPAFPSTDLNALTVTAAAGTAGKIVFTFAKTGGGAVNLNTATLIDANIIISIDSTGAIATPTSWTIGTAGGATQLLTANGLTAVKHDFVVTSNVKDINNIGCTVKAGSVTVS